MARTLVAQSASKPERPLAGRIFGLFTPILNRLVTRIAGKRHVPLYVLLRHLGLEGASHERPREAVPGRA